MKFTLCFKEYPFKMSLAAMRDFKEATGKCLWSTSLRFLHDFTESRAKGENLLLTLAKVGSIMDFEESAEFMYCLAKQENSQIKLAEIQDAMFHVGMTPSEIDGNKFEPYQIVILGICTDIQKHLQELAVEKKQEADS